jgi:serine/threonine-protein kinase
MPAIGSYEIERELGRGAFGAVYLAHHRDRPDWPVALKVVEARGGDPSQLLAEPALLAQVKHPCVVGVEDYFTAGGRLAIALEFVNGEDLKAVLDRGDTFTAEQVRTLLIQLGGALVAAHAQQIVHRDIKPANILVDRTGGHLRFVLTDFGIGRRQEGVQAERHAGGTYHFMAPEQLRGRPGPQSDLWALGVVAYRLLTGRLPFPGRSLPELARQIQYETPPPPGEVRGEPLPSDLEAAVMKLLDKSLNERTASAEQLLTDLGYKGDSTKVTQAPSGAAGRQQEPVQRRLARSVARNRRLLIACVLVYMLPTGVISGGLLLAGIALFFTAQSGDRGRGWRRVVGLIAAAFVVLALSRAWSLWDWWDVSLFGVGEQKDSLMGRLMTLAPKGSALEGTLTVLAPLLTVGYYLFLPVIGSAYYAELRRARRDQALWDAALAGHVGSDEFLATMRGMVDTRIEDVGFHLRYAEMLFARGDHRAAAVEARLLLVQDPYHFNGNLLLANAYAALGLWQDCLSVCDDYLQVTGYCFEFGELRQQCLGRLGRS